MADTTETTTCEHGFRHPVICPQCDPETYGRAKPQVERFIKQRTEAAWLCRVAYDLGRKDGAESV